MKVSVITSVLSLLLLSACGAPGEVGDECASDDDCAEGLECHFHDDHDDHDEEEHDEEEHDDHEGEEEEHGECEEHEEHEDE